MQVIKNPMFFHTIEDRLRTEKYTSPSEFHADVALSFQNCFTYNPINDPFRKLGEKVSTQHCCPLCTAAFYSVLQSSMP